jgi:hypothetical protein
VLSTADLTGVGNVTVTLDGNTVKISGEAGGGVGSAGITIDGGGSAITSGIKGDTRINYNGTITNVTLLCDKIGTIELDIWKDSYANFPPTVADSIVASNYPNTSSAAKYEDSTLTSWTTSITSGDVLRFVVNNNATSITRAHLVLTILKT